MTIKEIAELAGTSRGTVDRVLNGRGHVRADLAQRVQAIAEEYGYTPNHLARALVNSQKNPVVGVVINSVGNPFFADVLRGIKRQAQYYKSFGLSVVVKEIQGYDESEQLEAIEEIMEQKVDGLGITPLDMPSISKKLNSLDIPIVTFNTDISNVNRLAFVGCDYINSGKLTGDMAKLLMPRGGSIGVIIGSRHMQGHMQRVEGIKDSLKESANIEIVSVMENNDDDEKSYYVTQIMIKEHNPDLIYFAAAGIEGGIRAILDDHEKRLVLTVDGNEFTRRCLKAGIISATVTQQPEKQGTRTVEILYNHLVNNKTPKQINHYTENQVKLRSSK